MPKVSRTLWSVISTPMPRALRWRTIFWISPTEIGSTGDLDPAAFAARQAGAQLFGDVADLQFFHQRGQFVGAAGGVEVLAQFKHRVDVVGDAELAEHRGFLGQVAQAQAGAFVHGQAGDVPAVERDAAGVGADQAHDHVKAGGLAGAVGAEQADDFAGAHFHREVVHHLARAVALGQAGCGEHQSAAAFLGRMRMDTRAPSPPPSMRPVLMSYFTVSPRRLPRGWVMTTLPVSIIDSSASR